MEIRAQVIVVRLNRKELDAAPACQRRMWPVVSRAKGVRPWATSPLVNADRRLPRCLRPEAIPKRVGGEVPHEGVGSTAEGDDGGRAIVRERQTRNAPVLEPRPTPRRLDQRGAEVARPRLRSVPRDKGHGRRYRRSGGKHPGRREGTSHHWGRWPSGRRT